MVTGAAGFIGSQLTEAVLAAGHRVVGIDAFTPYYRPRMKRANIAAACRHPRFQLLIGDLNQLDLTEVLRPGDVVFHLAAQPGVRSSWGRGFAEYTRHNVGASNPVRWSWGLRITGRQKAGRRAQLCVCSRAGTAAPEPPATERQHDHPDLRHIPDRRTPPSALSECHAPHYNRPAGT